MTVLWLLLWMQCKGLDRMNILMSEGGIKNKIR
jgi:hypothetical protein